MNALTQKPVTSGQKRQIRTVAHDALEKALDLVDLDKLSKEEAQRVHASGHILASAIRKATSDSIRRIACPGNLYPSNYDPKIVDWQIHVLQFHFPHLVFTDRSPISSSVKLPDGAERLFVIPRWEKIALTYAQAVEKVFQLLSMTRSGAFTNREESPSRSWKNLIIESPKKNGCLDEIGRRQKHNDILVFPAQFGLKYAGIGDEEALRLMGNEEFGLGAFEVGIMILTNPTRMAFGSLIATCPGDYGDMDVCCSSTIQESSTPFNGSPYFVEVSFLEFGIHDRCGNGIGCGPVSDNVN